MKIKPYFRAFAHRNYRLFFVGQGISLIGMWMQRIATSWLTYKLTNSPLILGVVSFFGQFPTFLFAPFAGVIADKKSRYNIILITQFLSMIQAFTLALLTLTNSINILALIILSTFLAIINGFDMPTRQSFIVEMVGKDDLQNAIALNSTMFNSARVIGPAIAGILIALYGEGICFLINGVSFIAILYTLLSMKIENKKLNNNSSESIISELKEGIKYTLKSKLIFSALLLLALVSLIGMPYMVLMPIFAEEILHKGSQGLGFLMTSSGFGAILGGIYLATLKGNKGLSKIITFSALSFGITLILFALSKSYLFSMIIISFIGFTFMTQMTATNTLIQNLVSDDMRGRVMSFYTMAFIGTAPLGSLLAGNLAECLGAPLTLILSGILCILGGVIYAFKNL